MRATFLLSILSFFLLVTPAFALNITLSTDKEKVFLGESFTLTGKITLDSGGTGTFQYRAAVVAPRGIIVCDSNKTTTTATGTFTLTCKAPTKAEAGALGIPAASDRAVMPLRPGVVVLDPQKNVTVKKHMRVVLAVNPDKFKARANEIASQLNAYIKNTDVILSECNKLGERAQKFNVTTVADRCQAIKDKVNAIIADANNISAQATQAANNINTTDLEDFKAGLSIIRDDMKALRDELKNLRDQVKAIRWDTLKEVREVKREVKEIRENVQEKRQEIKKLTERIKEVRKTGESEVSR